MLAILDKHKIKRENTIAVGNSLNDMCMIKEAGMGIAFCSKDELVNHHADIMISEPGFAEILKVAK
ncbi:MAG: HAD hydrolase family protein [Hydrotalea flava]|nr:HAD hydrolase family protein [Hydrotalea flava]NIM36914.1 HAD hydrolase family protein [Hydrotalea flava]NIN02106.1 HAD hydrolase family protein [Hydrotalea flava]NIN13759.1 HAD hydrolase family protein [Hydrotalea flava]NIO92840.1 HAD hydrolase family protein [Hydrotalea flava]